MAGQHMAPLGEGMGTPSPQGSWVVHWEAVGLWSGRSGTQLGLWGR